MTKETESNKALEELIQKGDFEIKTTLGCGDCKISGIRYGWNESHNWLIDKAVDIFRITNSDDPDTAFGMVILINKLKDLIDGGIEQALEVTKG